MGNRRRIRALKAPALANRLKKKNYRNKVRKLKQSTDEDWDKKDTTNVIYEKASLITHMSKNKELFKGSKPTKIEADETALSDIALLTHKRIKKGKVVAENPKAQKLLDASLEIAEIQGTRPRRALITKDEAKIV